MSPRTQKYQSSNMKLEQQVTSLELSKRLEELGVEQESLFFWQGTAGEIELGRGCALSFGQEIQFLDVVNVSAFTVAELGEILPGHVTRFKPNGDIFSSQLSFWNLSYKHMGRIGVWQDEVACLDFEDGGKEGSEANVRAKMLIYLIENKLITL
jgi:hypothetical protein